MCIIPQSQARGCASHCGFKWPKFHKNSPVCIKPQSQAPRCASHHGVKLCGVHHTVESSSAVCITPQSQNWKFCFLWLLLNGQSGEILSGVNTSVMKEKIWSKFFRFAKLKILTPHRRVEFVWSLWSNISAKSKPNSKILYPVIRGPDGFESWKKIEVENLVTHSL